MTDDIIAYASRLHLSRADIKKLRVHDAYGVHRVVYQLYEDVRSDSEKNTSYASGFLYADKGGDFNGRTLLILSNRPPRIGEHQLSIETKAVKGSFLTASHYGFETTINPSKRDSQTGKTVAIRGRENISKWFVDKAPHTWGFEVDAANLQLINVEVQRFNKENHTVTHSSATLRGTLRVVNQEMFRQSFLRGIGRGRAFGFGLLQLIKLS
jgi:CRISPR system Cascade subunit CasE